MTKPRPETEVLLWTARQVGAALGLSARSVMRLSQTGTLPAPVFIGRLVRWKVDDIREFVNTKGGKRWGS